MIPFLDMTARYARTSGPVEAAISEVLRSGRYIGGPVVASCEAAIAALLGRSHGIGTPSGTAAITKLVRAIGIRPGDEVIVPAVTFFSTAGGIMRAGGVPVIVDVLPDRPLLDPDAAADAITPRTRAVMPVHLFGDTAPHPDIGLTVLDDAAQAVGASPPAGQGLAAAVSFYPTKILGAFGDGGMIVTDDDDLAEAARALGFHGLIGPHLHALTHGHMGGNARLDAVQAAGLMAQLDDLPARIAIRRSIAARYDVVVGDLAVPRDAGSPVSIYCLRHPERDALQARLLAAGVQTSVYYPRPLDVQPALEGCPRHPAPNAAAFCREALALPCYEAMPEAHVEQVVAALRVCL
ncbi:MAG: dTDP-4-amino-4,6-dideoxygalactose transaminase [Myxococcota bacterium]|jgi:dTDP-4-amino-4,6-dideoxygalactose transaminase